MAWRFIQHEIAIGFLHDRAGGVVGGVGVPQGFITVFCLLYWDHIPVGLKDYS